MKIGKHRARPIRFLGLHRIDEWYVKLYGISQHDERPDSHAIAAALEVARKTLPKPPVTDSRYGVGFVTVHQASMFNQVIVDWWERVNELRHRVWKATPEAPFSFADITSTGEAFCIWELRVIGFERDAWLETVLRQEGSATTFDRYLRTTLDEEA